MNAHSVEQVGVECSPSSGSHVATAATLLVETGDPFRFASESKFARAAPEPSQCHRRRARRTCPASTGLRREPTNQPCSLHRQRHQQRDNTHARAYRTAKISEGKTRREARWSQTTRQPHHPTHVEDEERRLNHPSNKPLDKGALYRPHLSGGTQGAANQPDRRDALDPSQSRRATLSERIKGNYALGAVGWHSTTTE